MSVPVSNDKMKSLTESFRSIDLARYCREKLAAEIIPLEMWEYVFLKLDPLNAKDLHTVMNTTSVWNELLHRRKTLVLFPLIVDLLKREKLLSPRDLLNCRQVCQTWKRGLEKFDATHSYFQNRLVEHPLARTIPRFPVIIPFGPEFPSRKRVNIFTRHMRNHPGNPFVSRSVTFNQKRPSHQGLKLFYKQAVLLLRTFGQHVWELGISGYINLAQLRLLLAFVPNVRCVRLLSDCEMWEASIPDPWTKLPPLPHLVSIQIPSTLDERVTRLLLKSYSTKIKTSKPSKKRTKKRKRHSVRAKSEPVPSTSSAFPPKGGGEGSFIGLPSSWALPGLQLSTTLKPGERESGQVGDVLVVKKQIIGRRYNTEYYYSPVEHHRRHADHTFYFLPEMNKRLQFSNVKLFKTRLKITDELLEKMLRFKLTGTQELVIIMEKHSSEALIEETSEHARMLIAKFSHLQRVVLDAGKGRIIRLPTNLPDFYKWRKSNGVVPVSLFN